MSSRAPLQRWLAAAEPLLAPRLSMGCGEPLEALSGALANVVPGGPNPECFIQVVEALGRTLERNASITTDRRR